MLVSLFSKLETIRGFNSTCAEYSVQLDTGSSDLFIKGDTYPIPNTTVTVSSVVSFNHTDSLTYSE